MNDPFAVQPYESELGREPAGFDVLRALKKLKDGWRSIAAVIAICLLAGLAYLHIAKPVYTATIILSPTQSQTQGVSGSVSELASMAGISIGKGQSVSPYTLFPYTLMSRAVADDMARTAPDVMRTIFRSQWDDAVQKWVPPRGIAPIAIRMAKGILGMPLQDWTPPGGGELQLYIKGQVSVEQAIQKPVLTITYDYGDRIFAAHFLQALYASTDRVLRHIALDRSSKYALYLTQQLRTAQLSELRQVMMESLNEQETLLMMSSSDTPFAAQPLGSAASSIRPTSPNVPVVIALAVLFGLVLGSAALLADIDLSRLLPVRVDARKAIQNPRR